MGYYFVSFLYVATIFAVGTIELRRRRELRVDPTGAFILLVALQLLIPGVLIFSALPGADATTPTGIGVFDYIYRAVDVPVALTVWTLTFLFILFFYVGSVSTRAWLVTRFGSTDSQRYDVRVRTGRMYAVLLAGLAVSVMAFQSLGGSIAERYVNLVLLRALDLDRTALAANALALMQAWSWLTIIAFFAAIQHRLGLAHWGTLLVLLVFFSVLGVSRRALFLPIVFAYLILLMHDGKWRVAVLTGLAVPIMVWVGFGQGLIASLGYGGNLDAVQQTYSSLSAFLVRVGSEVGITVTESLGTIAIIDIAPRYGFDHLLSVARRFPEGLLGMSIDFPERIVRTSTAAFAHRGEVDLPPGLLGQMWLDFRVLGPLVWGLIFGAQVGILQYLFEKTRRTLTAAATYFVLVFVIALPLNSGSFDFTFSVDIFALVVVMLLCIRVRRITHIDPIGARALRPANS